jgi:protein required for attachment to host cells
VNVEDKRLNLAKKWRDWMILPKGSTVAVVDGSRIRLFQNKGAEHGGHLVEIAVQGVERENAGSGSRHHTGAANPDSARLTEDDFSAAAAAVLNKLSLEGAIEHLVLIADPRTLGEMRRHLSSEVVRKIIRDFPKDLIGHSTKEIAHMISKA